VLSGRFRNVWHLALSFALSGGCTRDGFSLLTRAATIGVNREPVGYRSDCDSLARPQDGRAFIWDQ